MLPTLRGLYRIFDPRTMVLPRLLNWLSLQRMSYNASQAWLGVLAQEISGGARGHNTVDFKDLVEGFVFK